MRRQPGIRTLGGFGAAFEIEFRLDASTLWQFHADGHVRLFMRYAGFQSTVASVELPAGGVSPLLVYPGGDVFCTMDGTAGVNVLITTLGPWNGSATAAELENG